MPNPVVFLSQLSSLHAASHFSTFSRIYFLLNASSFTFAIWTSTCSKTQEGSMVPTQKRKNHQTSKDNHMAYEQYLVVVISQKPNSAAIRIKTYLTQ